MKHSKMSKLIAAIAAGVMLLSSFTASAQLAFTADQIFDSTQIGTAGMLSGFSVDSKDYSWQTQGQYGGKYGVYHPHMNWDMNRVGWNAEDSMNIFPIGTPDTAYSTINSEETFFAAPYAASYVGTDFQIWDGYMFVVLEKTTWPKDENGADIQNQNATLDSVIQVYNIAEGAKEHVATWDAEDLGLGGTAEGITYGIREIEVTDDNIFVLVDMAGENWTYKYDWSGAPLNTQGCGLAVYDNNISREAGDVAVPTRSALQPMGDANSDMARYGVDVQPSLVASDSLNKGAVFMARGDYLFYMPTAANGVLKSLYNSDATWLARNMGVYTVKWNEERTAGQKVEFAAQTIAEWIPFPEYPEDYRGMEPHSYGNYPQLGALSIDGDVMYADIVYTKPDEEGVYHQYDEVYTIDISNPLEPTILGKTAPISSPTEINFTNRVMTFDEDYIYISQKHYHHFDDLVKPYIFIIDKQDMRNPVCVNTFALRNYQQNAYSKGAESIAVVSNYMIVHSNEWTIFMEMRADRTEIVDSVAMENMMAIGDRSGGVHGAFIYGNRIFYPSLHGTVVRDGWRFDSRIEVIDFSAALPMGLYVDEITNNGDDTYTISGRVQGVEVLPNLYDIPVITINDTEGEWVGEVYYGDLETEVDGQMDVSAWSFTTDADMPANLIFVLNDTWGDMIEDADGNPKVYENVNLELVGVDPVFTLTGEAPAAIAAGDYTVTLNASNMTARDIESAVVVVAVYDGEGKLVAVKTGNPEAIASGVAKGLAPVTATVPQAESYDGYTAKALLLDSVEGLAPICANLEF